ncbi:MAG: hypothetical protein AAF432_00100 [Planctomycetota bacterium]
MTATSRRQVLGVVACAAAGAAPADAVFAEPHQDEQGEPVPSLDRLSVLDAGMTEDEADCWALAAELAGTYMGLPVQHQEDWHEVAHAIHVVQSRLLARPTYRRYLEAAKRRHGDAP